MKDSELSDKSCKILNCLIIYELIFLVRIFKNGLIYWLNVVKYNYQRKGSFDVETIGEKYGN